MQTVKFIGFAPDIDPAQPGVLTDVTDMIPTINGMKGRQSPVDAGYAAMASACRGLAVIRKLDGSRRIFSGTAAKLYEYVSGTLTDRSKGGGYSLGADNWWSWCQFGDVTIAATKTETLQYSTTGAFADVSGAPKANLCAVSEGFVMLANTNEGTYGDQSDRWWCSAYLDYTDWTPSVTTQCTTGRLVDAPGPITALKPLGSGFVAYKDNAIIVANYVESPTVWQWSRVPGDIGAASNQHVVEVGNLHYFLGNDDFYAFDGTRPVPIGGPIRGWFFRDADTRLLHKTQTTYNPITGNVWFFYHSQAGGGALDSAVVYNIRTNKWGHVSLTIEAVGVYYTSGVTFDGLGTEYATWNDLPTGISFDSPYWTAESPEVAVVKTDHKTYTLTGASESSQVVTGIYGDGESFSTVQRVIPRFLEPPDTSQITHQYSDTFGTDWSSRPAASLTDNRYDVLWSSRWHRFILDFTGDVEIAGAGAVVNQDGTE